MRNNVLIITILLSTALSMVPALAQPASELLEKGVYIEETAGDVRQAKAIYRQIITDATADRATVAEALFRLGVCHLKTGNTAGAFRAFERILADYPDEEHFVALAREQMPADPNTLELLPAPWPDGEVMRLTLKLASGTPIGAMLMTADASERDGEELWRLRVRRKVFSDATNQAVSEVLAHRDTMIPVASVFKHSLAGHFEAQYGDGSVSIETAGVDATREQALAGLMFDNEEGFHLFRRLPLEVGYKETIKFISTMAGGGGPIEVEITEKERVTVPAGDFECYRMELSIPQVFWYSTDPSQVLVKFEAAGVVGELAEVYVQEPARENVVRNETLGYSLSLPPDWLSQTKDDPAGTHVLLLLDPGAEALARLEIRRPPASDGCFFQAAAHQKLGQARTTLPDYTLREGTWRERTLAGWPAVSFVGDYRDVDRQMAHYWTFIGSDELCTEFTLKAPADRFEALRGAFDSIIESYEGPPPPVAAVSVPEAVGAVESVLADFHRAASDADPRHIFEHLAPDAVFFGPDAADRFDARQLRERFPEVSGWLAEPSDLHVAVSDDETLAWFDERLANPRLGELRASGVLRREGGLWKIVQVHVALPVPNELVTELVEKLRAHDEEVGRQPADSAPPFEEAADDPAGSAGWLLRDIHLAKSEADGERYFGHFAPDAIALGTDRSERFTLAALRALVGPYFARGQGSTSIPIEQHVYLSPSREMAWFEELVERKHLGRMRGTGVMRKVDGVWKLAHYNLVILVPKVMTEDLARRIDAFYAPS